MLKGNVQRCVVVSFKNWYIVFCNKR